MNAAQAAAAVRPAIVTDRARYAAAVELLKARDGLRWAAWAGVATERHRVRLLAAEAVWDSLQEPRPAQVAAA